MQSNVSAKKPRRGRPRLDPSVKKRCYTFRLSKKAGENLKYFAGIEGKSRGLFLTELLEFLAEEEKKNF